MKKILAELTCDFCLKNGAQQNPKTTVPQVNTEDEVYFSGNQPRVEEPINKEYETSRKKMNNDNNDKQKPLFFGG